MKNKIINRILQTAQSQDLMETLTKHLSLTDLQSLLLEVYREQTKRLTPRNLFEQYNQNRFVQISKVDPQKFLEFDRLAFSLLPADFEVLELSPVCPLGTCSIISTVDQNNTLTTIRNTEVCSDSTNVLALECARRRRFIQSDKKAVRSKTKLCASHRVLRTQTFDEPGAYPHFRLFGLCTAGRDEGSYRFEIDTLKEHIEFYIRLLQEAKNLNMTIEALKLKLLLFDHSRQNSLKSHLIDVLSTQYPSIQFEMSESLEDQNYYTGVRFQIYATDKSEMEYLLVDGGFTDWTKKLLSNSKERLLISGIGSERLLTCFNS